MSQVFGCGTSYLLNTLIKGLITEYSSTRDGDNGCSGIRIIEQTWENCTVLTCGSNETFETLLRKAIVTDSNGHPALNIVIIKDATDVANCGTSGESVEMKLKKCFCNITGSNDIALVLLKTTELQ